MGYLKASICLDDLFSASKSGHSAFNKGKNGKTYVNAIIWTNEQPDQFGNIGSIQLMQPKESTEKKVYVGSIKGNKPQDEQPTQPTQPTHKATHMDITQSDVLPF